MSLWGTLNVGRSALASNQIALQTVGNNIANAGNENYTRQRVELETTTPQEIRSGIFVGTGVDVADIRRSIDNALEARLRSANSDTEAANQTSTWLSRVESVFNELTDQDLSTSMSTFFTSWSTLANKPQDIGQRQVVLQTGQTLATQIRSTRSQISALTNDADVQLRGLADSVNKLTSQIASLNQQISTAEGAQGTANSLRDQRDGVIKELAKHVNVNTNEQANGMVDIFIGNDPLVTDITPRSMSLLRETARDGEQTLRLVYDNNGGPVNATSGVVGSTLAARETIKETLNKIDSLAGALIFELNKVHSSGQGLQGASSITSQNVVTETSAALNSDEADLDFKPGNGSFVVHVKDKATGATTSSLVSVKLDGTGTQTSLDSLASSIDGIDNISASISSGKLSVSADSSAVEISFSQDSSGTLAALGIGSFYKGTDGRDIAVSDNIASDVRLLAASRNGQGGDNQTALAIAALQTQSMGSLNGQNLKDTYQGTVNEISGKVAGARQDADSFRAVQDSLQAQREAVSGVSMDEEAISLLRYQRAYQGAARVVQVADELMQTLLRIAG